MKNKKTKGAFCQLDNGQWMIDTKIKVNNKWCHLSKKGYRTLQDAKLDFENVKQAYIRSKAIKQYDNDFNSVLIKYAENRSHLVRQSTLESDQSIYNTYFYPFFDHLRLENVFNQGSIHNWFVSLSKKANISNARKSKIITKMKDLINFCYNHKLITAEQKQDCDCCLYQFKADKKAKTERIIWTSEEEVRFFGSFKTNPTKYLMYKLFYMTGTRIGEFLALMPKCFNRETKTITICQQVQNIKNKGAVCLDQLKNYEGYRTIEIDGDTSAKLANYIDSNSIDSDSYIFSMKKDHSYPIGKTTFKRELKKDCIRANVRPINPHAVRHMMAVKLASACENAMDIEASSQRMGHTASVFLNIYANHKKSNVEAKILSSINF